MQTELILNDNNSRYPSDLVWMTISLVRITKLEQFPTRLLNPNAKDPFDKVDSYDLRDIIATGINVFVYYLEEMADSCNYSDVSEYLEKELSFTKDEAKNYLKDFYTAYEFCLNNPLVSQGVLEKNPLFNLCKDILLEISNQCLLFYTRKKQLETTGKLDSFALDQITIQRDDESQFSDMFVFSEVEKT